MGVGFLGVIGNGMEIHDNVRALKNRGRAFRAGSISNYYKTSELATVTYARG